MFGVWWVCHWSLSWAFYFGGKGSFKLQIKISIVNLKKYTQAAGWELRFLWQEFLGHQARAIASQGTPRELSQGVEAAGREPGYIVLQQRAGSLNVKGLLLKKTRYLTEFHAFLCTGRCRSLGSLKSPLGCAPRLSGANTPCSRPELPQRSGRERLCSTGCWMAGLVLLPGSPWGLKGSHWRATVTDDYDILTWQEIFHFSSTWFVIYTYQILWSCSVSSVVSNSLGPHGPQHARPPYSSTPRVHPNPCPLSRWCRPTNSSSVVPFSSCPRSFPASGSLQMSQLFASGGQSIGVSASTSVLPMNPQDWSPLGWTGWISLQPKGLWRVFSNTTVQFFGAQLSL